MTLPGRSLCVVIHDVAPATWESCRWLLDLLAQRGVSRTTLLAVPRYHRQPRDAGFERWLRNRAAGGDEVALHGFEHLDDGELRGPIDRLRRRVYTRGEGEFAALGFQASRSRIEAGRRWLGDLGIEPTGFIAPAWLLGPEAWRALREQPFEYTCTLRHIHLLGAAECSIVCQSQVYSSATRWRQHLSVAWNGTLAALQRRHPVVRLELHPSDVMPLVRASWERLLRAQISSRRIRTLAEVAAALKTAREHPAP